MSSLGAPPTGTLDLELARGASVSGTTRLQGLGVFVLYLGLTVLLQLAGRAYLSEFDGYPDEAAHYVTGLMVRDYVAAGIPTPPMQYAEKYYLHYPKIALGHWPPGFYIVQAAWTLVFTPSRISILILMAAITSLAAFAIFRIGRRDFGFFGALALGAVFIAMPVVQENTGMVMAESLLALTGVLAAAAFGLYLETERPKYALWFGVWAFLTIMVKGNGWALMLISPIALLLTWRWKLLLRWPLWAAAGIITLSLPWQLATMGMARLGWEGQFGFSYTVQALWAYATIFAKEAGWALLLMALIGAGSLCAVPLLRRRKISGRWAAMTALPLAVWIFHSVVPAGIEQRKLILGLPGVLLLAGAGVAWIAKKIGPAWRWTPASVAALVGLAFAVQSFTIPRKVPDHFSEAATVALREFPSTENVLFVSASPSAEGAFIAAVAMHEARPGHFVLRASKIVGDIDWGGDEQTLRRGMANGVEGLLDRLGVEVVAVETNGGEQWIYRRPVFDAVARHPDKWIRVDLPASCTGKVEMFRRIGPRIAREAPIELDLTRTLGRVLKE